MVELYVWRASSCLLGGQGFLTCRGSSVDFGCAGLFAVSGVEARRSVGRSHCQRGLGVDEREYWGGGLRGRDGWGEYGRVTQSGGLRRGHGEGSAACVVEAIWHGRQGVVVRHWADSGDEEGDWSRASPLGLCGVRRRLYEQEPTAKLSA